jgi:uncharacterized damage-inducible protein DinB
MTDLHTVMADNRQAVSAFVADTRAVPRSQWASPRAPGKWSPGQVTEHVALAYELSRSVLSGSFRRPAKPWPVRLLTRLFVKRLLHTGRFGKGLTSPKPLQPTESPTAPEALIARLEAAANGLESDLAAAARTGQTTIEHPLLGHLSLAEFLQFQAIHTNHHRQQLPVTVPLVARAPRK